MTRYQGKVGNVGLEQLQRELVTPKGVRPVEDVKALPLADQQELDRVLPRHGHTNRRSKLKHFAMDRIGEPCKCDDQTPCLAHWDQTGRRRHVRPR